jgi:hypothetical protein
VNALDLMKRRVNGRFRADELRQSDLRERVFDDFVQSDDDGTNAAIAFVNADEFRLQNAPNNNRLSCRASPKRIRLCSKATSIFPHWRRKFLRASQSAAKSAIRRQTKAQAAKGIVIRILLGLIFSSFSS